MDDTSGRVADGPAVSGAAAGPDTETRVVEIRAEIEHTREELSETIDAIQERLRPRNIVAGATERVKAATTEKVKDMAHTAGETAHEMAEQTRYAAGDVTRSVRENPVPAVLIGIGTAWLLMNRSGSGPRAWSDPDRRLASAYRGTGRDAYASHAHGGDRARIYRQDAAGSGFLDRITQHPVPAALAGVGLAWLALVNGDDGLDRPRYYGIPYGRMFGADRPERADEARSGYDSAASGIAGTASDVASRTQEYLGDAAGDVRWRSRRAGNQLQRLLHENPLMVGAAAVVLGAAVGMALPETEREREWMGDARDQMMDRAQEMAENAAERVQETAGEVAGQVISRVVSGKDE